jgi:ATP-dependent DNA helicase DinG
VHRFGKALIDKLPFPSPGDPLVQARSRRIQQQGGNAFAAYHLAEAAVSLKQGAGRLIRHEGDMGALVVTDARLMQSSYSRRLLHALPPMQRVGSEAELLRWLGTLSG